jgi:sulfite oxidase
VDAELDQSHDHKDADLKWAWTLWKAKVKVGKGKDVTIYSKATDSSGQTQQKSVEWNFRGVGYNAWGEASDIEVV